MKAAGKTDRRTLLTKTIIQDAFLESLEEAPFDRITVAGVCRRAEIPRSTFYIHYSDLTHVVDELIDMALNVALRPKSNLILSMFKMREIILSSEDVDYLKAQDRLLPVCQNIADNPKFRPLFFDNELSAYITKRIYLAEKDQMVPEIVQYCGISEAEAEMVFRMVLNGIYSVNRTMGWEKNLNWYKNQETMLRLVLGGFNALSQHNGKAEHRLCD